MQADTPWSLFVALDIKEPEQYLKNRQDKGFNKFTVNLLEHWFNGEILAYPAASMNRDVKGSARNIPELQGLGYGFFI
jgi:hypothetical protein